nr:MFS transporter [Desulfobacterales bacterium]
FLPLFASTRLDLSSSIIGMIVAMNVLVSGIFQTPMGFLADRLDKKLLIITGGILAIISMFYIGMASSFKELLLANGIFGLAGGISIPATMALGVIEGRRIDAMGSMMGLLTMAHSLGMLTGPILAGILLDLFSFTSIFVFGMIIMGVGTIVFFFLNFP